MLNPIVFTEHVVQDFLRYQLTAYPFSDRNLYEQMLKLLNLEETRRSPLLKGPYVSLSRTFEEGISVAGAIQEGWLHPHLEQLISHPHLYGHQEQAIRAITGGKTTLVSTGTGSGKTECFLYPIISRCLQLRDDGAAPGIASVIVYPMNALADDQMDRLRELLAGTGIRFGIYTGALKEHTRDAPGFRLPEGSSAADYRKRLEKERNKPDSRDRQVIHPPEENISREEMRDPAKRPRLLLTNVKQLELLLTRQKDIEMFDDASLDFLVFDEAHTLRGSMGAETACLIRRLRAYCGKAPEETTCVATSATIVDPNDPGSSDAGRQFAARFFGVAADTVELVGELYQPDVWAPEDQRSVPPALNGKPADHLSKVLEAVEMEETEAGKTIAMMFVFALGVKLPEQDWRLRLFEELSRNELLFQMVDLLDQAKNLETLSDALTKRVGRPVSDEEVLLWLALGAASRKEERPLVRPVIHTFVRGMGGAVVSFPTGANAPKLNLSAESVATDPKLGMVPKTLQVLSCTTCGQHYFEHWASDFQLSGARVEGGLALDEDRQFWEACDEANEGKRLVLIDRLIAQDDDDDSQPGRTEEVYLCRACGGVHSHSETACKGCGRKDSLLKIYAVHTNPKNEGRLSSCLCCGARSRNVFGRTREPARPVRATTVSDVHVLGQNMLHHANRKRLLVFADNRQDAAFQAGWMQDHARRYRLRALIYERLKEGELSVGDLVAWLDDRLENDDSLSNAIAPEVWRAHRKKGAALEHQKARKFFLRSQVFRELAMGMRQRIGLEPWGRMEVRYDPLDAKHDFFQKWAGKLNIGTDELLRGVELLLDRERRSSYLLLDRENHVFTRLWKEGMREIQRGFIPLIPGAPKGLVLNRSTTHNENRIRQWLGHGNAIVRQAMNKWGVAPGDQGEFGEDLWHYLCNETRILVETRLLNTRNEALSGCDGAHQIDGDLLLLSASENGGAYQCRACRQSYNRRPPLDKCLGHFCQGEVSWEPEKDDNYDLQVLDKEFTMVRPREHSAQVPQADRTISEQHFKGTGEAVNCLVCTPTLELGVDIGQLDSVLMRNVPPLPANYFQRTGRAGRRHRMAVNLTYARPASHDRAFFEEPEKLLNGVVLPPRFNLSNPVLVRHHGHAALLTDLFRLVRGTDRTLSESRKEALKNVLAETFPSQIRPFFFDTDGRILSSPRSVAGFAAMLTEHRERLIEAIDQAFTQGWPAEDQPVIQRDRIEGLVDSAAQELESIIDRIWQRLKWHINQMERLREEEKIQGVLSDEEQAFRRRCENFVQKIKGEGRRARAAAEGFDDTNIYAVLAAEGWLPGYGLEAGSIVGSAIRSISSMSREDFDLPRPSAVAVREYVPGNLIYANGERYTPRLFRLPPEEPTLFSVDFERQSIAEVDQADGGLSTTTVKAMPICDVEMPHLSHISDEEDFRFQVPVMVAGLERQRHDGGTAYKWGSAPVFFRKNVHLRLVNLGTRERIANDEPGYPVCLVTGQSRSPYASQAELDNFRETQIERVGKAPEDSLCFFADVIAETIKIHDFEDQQAAYSVGEALRLAGALTLDMEPEDLQLLVIPQNEEEGRVDLVIYDPMLGGSGLLKRMIANWPALVKAATALVGGCPSLCDSSCPDCLQRFRNAFYHRFLDRHTAKDYFLDAGTSLDETHDLPPDLPSIKSSGSELSVNQAEDLFLQIIKKAGLPEPECQREIPLPNPFGRTLPDFFYEDPKEATEGICIYLDGLSEHIHGNPKTQAKDEAIRSLLRDRDFTVLTVTASQLDDSSVLQYFIYKLARKLVDRKTADRLRQSSLSEDND